MSHFLRLISEQATDGRTADVEELPALPEVLGPSRFWTAEPTTLPPTKRHAMLYGVAAVLDILSSLLVIS